MYISKTLIVIPVYNGVNFISRSLESCLKQSVPTDICVVDNNSTDGTPIILKEFAQKYNQITIVNNDTNCGRMANWNRCIDYFMDNKKYEYLKFVFCGDEIFEDCIAESEKAFKIDNEIGAIAFPYEFFHKNGRVSISRHSEYSNQIFDPKEITKINLCEGQLLGAIICNVYAKHAIRNFRFDTNFISKSKFDIHVLEDKKAYYLDKILARFNLDCHNTFNLANSPYVKTEFSYIELKELHRISQKDTFTINEVNYIEQKIVFNTILRLIPYMNIYSVLIIPFKIFTLFLKNSFQKIYDKYN